MTHDYKRHGTTTLFAAGHRPSGASPPKFLRRIDAETPKKPPSIPRSRRGWQNILASGLLAQPGRTGLITSDQIRCGVFKSVAELETAIQEYLEHHNADPKPFVWTASATAILEKVARGRQALESIRCR